MKTIKQMLITIVVLLCSTTGNAHDFEVDGIYYDITSTGNLTVNVTYKGTSENEYKGNVVIPSTVVYNNKTYRVTGIGYCAFEECDGLVSLTIPSSITNINSHAFLQCTSLKELRIEDGEKALKIDGQPFYDCPLETLYLGRNLTSDGSNKLFYDKQLLSSLTIGNYVTIINDYIFMNCSGLTSIVIPNSVTSIGYNAFEGCTNLNDIFYTATTPPTSLWIAKNTYVPNKEAYSKVTVSGGSGNFIEYVTFQSTTYTYGENLNITSVNNLASIGYEYSVTLPELPRNSGTHTIGIPFTFSKEGYKFDINIPYTYTINKAPLTVKAEALTRLYGENNPELAISYSGFIDGENESVLTDKGTATTFANTKSDVGEYPITISGVIAENYEPKYENGTLRVNKAPLTVAVNNSSRIYGNYNPKFEFSYSGLKNDETSPEMITAFNVATVASKTSSVGEYEIVVSGGEAKNYEIVGYTNGKLTISKAPITVIANNTKKVYGDDNPSFGFSCSGLKNDDTANTIFNINPTLICTATNDSNVGDYEITVGDGKAYNYEIVSYVSGTLTITKAPLSISANNYTRLYGDKNPTFGYTCTGLKNGDNPNEIFNIEPEALCSATEKSSVGEYDINIIGGESKNYNIVNYKKGVLVIRKAEITVIANNSTKVYGDENPEFNLTYKGLQNGETSPEMIKTFIISTNAAKSSNIGEYNITVSGGEAKNYEIMNYINGKLTIIKAPLTVVARNFTKIYGDKNPDFIYSYNGAKNNDDESTIFEVLPTISCLADETSNVGEYEIGISGAASNNYEISYKGGTLSINKREITVSTRNYNRIYGEENPQFEIFYNGFINNEDESVLLIKPKAKTIAERDSDVGVYDINIEGGDDDNYSFTYNNGTLTIEKANQTIIWEQDFNDLTIGSQIELTAKANSGLDIEYVIPENDFVSIYTVGSKTYLDCYATGEIVIRATQDGNKNYNAAVRVSKVIIITPTSISNISADANIRINGYSITLVNANNSCVAVYSTNGTLIEKIDNYTGEEIILDKGVYIVQAGNTTNKVKL